MRRLLVSLLITATAVTAVSACVGDEPILGPTSVDRGADGSTAAPDGGGTDGRVDDDAGDATTKADAAPSDAGDAANSDGGQNADAGVDASTCTPPATAAHVLFLNRSGGTYAPGATDSRTNTTTLASQTSTVTAWTIDNQTWKALVDCVGQKFAPFNVMVTDVDPNTAAHIEIVFAQSSLPLLFGQPSIAPFTCTAVPNAVAFVSQTYASTPANGCAAVAANVGYSLGLEPVTVCPDAMSFSQTSCVSAAFSNTPLQCGTNAAAACQCTVGQTQNSFARVLAATGPRCL